jgi:hypothetical protein
LLSSARGAIILVFAAFGTLVGGHLGAIPVIFQNASLTDLFFGQAQSITMFFSLGAMLLGGWLGRYFDHRNLLLFLMPVCWVSLFYALMVQTQVTYLISIIFLAGLLSILDIHMNAEGAIIEEEVGTPIFSTFHAAVSAAMAVTAIFSSFVSVRIGPWASGIVALLVCGWAVFEVSRLVTPRPPHHETGPRAFSDLPFGKLILAGSALGSSGVCELLAVIYAGQLLVKLAPAFAEYSGLGVAFFAGCMAVVRLFGDRLRVRFGDRACTAVTISIAILGFLVLSQTSSFALSVCAYAAVGAGLAIISPILYPLAGRLAPAQRSSALGITFAVSNFFRFVTPALVGMLVSRYGLNAVYAVCAGFAIIALVLAEVMLSVAQKSKRRGSPLNPEPSGRKT